MQFSVVLFLCFSLILKCSSQDNAESEVQYSTEGSSGTQTVEWDTAESPLRTTAQNGGRWRYDQNTRPTSDYTTMFPNKWGPMMMPMIQPTFGTRIPTQDTTDIPKDRSELERRQRDPEKHLTQKNNQNQKTLDSALNPLPVPYSPYSPFMFYPENPAEGSDGIRYSIPNNSADDVNPLVLQDLSEKLNISASTADPYFYGLPNAGYGERLGRMPFPMLRYPPPPGYFLRNRPDGRNPENIVPFAPYGLPPYGLYPSIPSASSVPTDDGGPQVYPQVDIFVRPNYFDRELGTENLEPKEITVATDPSTTLNSPEVPPRIPGPADSVPAESVPRSPLPINPFPFGYYPQNIVPPPFFPLPQGDIPPPSIPSRFIPNVPVPPVDTLPPRITPILPPAAPVDRLPEIVPPPPPPAVDLPLPESPVKPPVPESGVVPEIAPPPGEVLTTDKELYEFGFDMNDGKGTDQHRQESKDETGVVTGSYGYRDAFGVYRLVNYIADKNGYRAFIQSNEPGVANPGSADVVVMAERPPPNAIAESLKPTQAVAIAVDRPDELIVQASETK